jgi:mono/diheme cytochrome c family protein
MKRALRYSLIGLAGVATLGASFVLGAAQWGERQMQRQVVLPGHASVALALRSDAQTIERGRYLFLSRGCADCHGAEGAGKLVMDDGAGLRVRAPNITAAPGSVVAGYGVGDWTRTVRHGVKPDGRPLMIMPSEDYARFTDADLAALIGFVRQLPAAPGPGTELRLPLPMKALYGLGVMKDASAKINHALPPAQPVPEAVTAEHGAYVAQGCLGWHGPQLAGGKIPGTPPDWPAAADLSPMTGGAMARYADGAAFMAMLRSGKRPDGSAISPVMPFAALKELNDTDAQALFLHLKSLPPVQVAAR